MKQQGVKSCRGPCGQEKSLDQFPVDPRYTGGHQNICKQCKLAYAKRKRSELRRYGGYTWDQRHRIKLKTQVLVHYSGGTPQCACCGEPHIEFLVVDHIEGGGNKHRKLLGIGSGVEFMRWLIENNYPSGFRVLCHNCNMSLGNFGYCPHNESLNGRVPKRCPETNKIVLVTPIKKERSDCAHKS